MLWNLSRRAIAVGIAAMGISGFVSAAQSPSTGLGEAWPNTTDVSLSPHYHVYVFVRDGVRYVQVNEEAGTVDAAVATADGTVLALPVGRYAEHVQVVHRTASSASAATTSTGATETIYRDATTTITATPQSNGTTQFAVAVLCSDPTRCSG